MTKEKVLKNLQNLIGAELNEDDIISAFEDFEENGKSEVYVGESHNAGYDYIAYINDKDATEFLFEVNYKNIIIDVWIA